jgi:hypothetical protein
VGPLLPHTSVSGSTVLRVSGNAFLNCASSDWRESENRFPLLRIYISSSSARDSFARELWISLDRYVCRMYIRTMKRISMFLSDTQIAALKKASKRTGLKVSELIRRFIDAGLKKA